MRAELLCPSLYLRAADLDGRDVTLTIRDAVLEQITRQGGQRETKGVLYFAETERKAREQGVPEKRMVLNKTNLLSIIALHGHDTEAWKGKKITLYTARVAFGREQTDAIRIRSRVDVGGDK